MPKMKTRKGAVKRFQRTAHGKIKMNKPFANHKLTKKTTKKKRYLRKSETASPYDVSRIKRMIST